MILLLPNMLLNSKEPPIWRQLSYCKGWLRGLDLNQRPSGYEPDELPYCSTPQDYFILIVNTESQSKVCKLR